MSFKHGNALTRARFFHSLLPPSKQSTPVGIGVGQREGHRLDPTVLPHFDTVIAIVRAGSSSEDEVFHSLSNDRTCNDVNLSHRLVRELLHRFRHDWKSAMGVFRWAQFRPGYKHPPESYALMVDILGKMKQMDRMKALVEEMGESGAVSLDAIAKAMRRLAGAKRWEDAVKVFDEIETYGLKKDTQSLNVLIDTLCKENKVERARDVFLKLKTHVLPNASTFNIFIHGWIKVKRVDEAHWTIHEMKGQGCRPCVISYSTIIQAYCQQSNFNRVYELLDEMAADGCTPNVVTFTTIMSSLTKSGEFDEALQLDERMKAVGCKPDTLYYNCLIHTLGRAGRLRDAIRVFEVEMPQSGVPPTTSTYNSIISMLCHRGREQKAFDFLKGMEDSGLCRPDVQTYYPLLKMCIKKGNVDTSLSELLNDMVNKHHLSFDLSTYTLLIHRLCRASECEWAYTFFEEMMSHDIVPKYHTCQLLLHETKQRNMYEAADRIETFMKGMKSSYSRTL